MTSLKKALSDCETLTIRDVIDERYLSKSEGKTRGVATSNNCHRTILVPMIVNILSQRCSRKTKRLLTSILSTSLTSLPYWARERLYIKEDFNSMGYIVGQDQTTEMRIIRNQILFKQLAKEKK